VLFRKFTATSAQVAGGITAFVNWKSISAGLGKRPKQLKYSSWTKRSVSVAGFAACVIWNVCPAMVNIALRGAGEKFGKTE